LLLLLFFLLFYHQVAALPGLQEASQTRPSAALALAHLLGLIGQVLRFGDVSTTQQPQQNQHPLLPLLTQLWPVLRDVADGGMLRDEAVSRELFQLFSRLVTALSAARAVDNNNGKLVDIKSYYNSLILLVVLSCIIGYNLHMRILCLSPINNF